MPRLTYQQRLAATYENYCEYRKTVASKAKGLRAAKTRVCACGTVYIPRHPHEDACSNKCANALAAERKQC